MVASSVQFLQYQSRTDMETMYHIWAANDCQQSRELLKVALRFIILPVHFVDDLRESIFTTFYDML